MDNSSDLQHPWNTHLHCVLTCKVCVCVCTCVLTAPVHRCTVPPGCDPACMRGCTPAWCRSARASAPSLCCWTAEGSPGGDRDQIRPRTGSLTSITSQYLSSYTTSGLFIQKPSLPMSGAFRGGTFHPPGFVYVWNFCRGSAVEMFGWINDERFADWTLSAISVPDILTEGSTWQGMV